MNEDAIARHLHDVATGKVAGGYPEVPTVGSLAFLPTNEGAVCEQFTGAKWVTLKHLVCPGSIQSV